MQNITEIWSLKDEMTADQFLKLIDQGKTDFSKCGRIRVIGAVALSRRTIKNEVDLGKLIFVDEFNCGSTVFEKSLHFNKAKFNKAFYFNSATFNGSVRVEHAVFNADFNLGTATYYCNFCLGEGKFYGSVVCGEAVVKQEFSFADAELFGIFFGGKLIVEILSCGRAIIHQSFFCGQMTINDAFDFGDANFCIDKEGHTVFSCGDLKFVDAVVFNRPTFNFVYADRTPALAWIINEFKKTGVQFDLHNVPPWVLPDWLDGGNEEE